MRNTSQRDAFHLNNTVWRWRHCSTATYRVILVEAICLTSTFSTNCCRLWAEGRQPEEKIQEISSAHNSSTRLAKDNPHCLGGWVWGGGNTALRAFKTRKKKFNKEFVFPSPAHTTEDETVVNLTR